MNLEYSRGERVVIERHYMDSEHAVDIGQSYKIAQVNAAGDQPYLLKGTRYGEWWVSAECLAPRKLEND
ncbi:hypothetical protein [Erwinia phage Pecta]|nr:hypothetical protein [Erwinia phage Pecta]